MSLLAPIDEMSRFVSGRLFRPSVFYEVHELVAGYQVAEMMRDMLDEVLLLRRGESRRRVDEERRFVAQVVHGPHGRFTPLPVDGKRSAAAAGASDGPGQAPNADATSAIS